MQSSIPQLEDFAVKPRTFHLQAGLSTSKPRASHIQAGLLTGKPRSTYLPVELATGKPRISYLQAELTTITPRTSHLQAKVSTGNPKTSVSSFIPSGSLVSGSRINYNLERKSSESQTSWRQEPELSFSFMKNTDFIDDSISKIIRLV